MTEAHNAEGPSPEPGAGGAPSAEDPRDAEIARLRRALEEEHDRLLRAVAETDNVRRRGQRDREEYTRYATESLLRDLIPVLDNLDRALEAARTSGDAPSVVEGVSLIQGGLLKVLERAGLERYSALGERFDPNRHEATGRVISATEPPETVVAETAPGYRLTGRVLRAALVVVAMPPEGDAP